MARIPYIAPPEWRTERVVLRSWRPGEGAKLSEAVNPSYEHLRRWMPWASFDQSVEESEARVRGFRGEWLLGTNFIMPILDPSEQRVLGGTGFHPRGREVEEGITEIGMWIRVEEVGSGLATHVATEMVSWAWAEWPWRRLTWHCDAENHASRRVAEKAGFALEGILREDSEAPDGTLRDTCRYALLRPR